MSEITLEEFIKQNDYNEYISKIEPSVLEFRYKNDSKRQMSDIWGEVDGCLQIYKKDHNKNNPSLLKQLDRVHSSCCVAYTNPAYSDGFKYELKVAEYELYDFLLWNNTFGNTEKTVTYWYDQWMFAQ